MRTKLLTRQNFKEAVFARDGHKCLFCELPPVDAHHIIDRSLFPDGGYYLDNGASVCEFHHFECEKTNISIEDVRLAAKITQPVLPPSFDPAKVYDKWGNEVLPSGQRLCGPLFWSDGCLKILDHILDIFVI